MAIIGKIQRQSTVLMIAIGGAMLLFVFGELITGGFSFVSSGDEVGEVKGQSITYSEFETTVQQRVEKYKESTQQLTLDQSTIDQIRDQTWNEFLQEKILLNNASDQGCGVSPEEIFDMVQGSNPHQTIIQNFTNPNTGQFNKADVLRYLQSIENDPTGQEKYRWALFERSLKQERQRIKYYNLIKKGLYVTTAEAKNDFEAKNKRVSVEFVQQRFDEISDSSVTVTESDLKSYYSNHKSDPKFQQKETTRSIEYVTFDVIPSDDDKAYTVRGLENLKNDFINAENDTLFVSFNANTRNNIKYYAKGEFPVEVDSLIYFGENGFVSDVFYDFSDNSYKLAKILGNKTVPDSVKASHILIKFANNDTLAAKNKADSLKNSIEKGADFAELAKSLSEDLGSAGEGGDLGWFTQGKMVKEFNDACFDGKVGDMPIVTSQFGVHLISIKEQTKPLKKVLVAVIDNELLPGKATYEKAYNESSNFSITNNTGEKFKQAASTVSVKIADNIREVDKNIVGLDSPRELVRWAYKAEIGDVSGSFELGDKFVVAHLTEIKEKGTLSFENVKELVKTEVIKEKKAETLIAQVSGSTSLQDAATKLGVTVETAENITFGSFSIPGIGGERALTGYVSGLKQGQLSEVIKGERGVYMIRVASIEEAPATADYSINKQQLARNYQSRVDYEVYQALEDISNVVDNRAKFY